MMKLKVSYRDNKYVAEVYNVLRDGTLNLYYSIGSGDKRNVDDFTKGMYKRFPKMTLID